MSLSKEREKVISKPQVMEPVESVLNQQVLS